MVCEVSKNRNRTFDDQFLTWYLLGALPAAVAQRLDELSIADDALAARLSAVENDLVDAYVRNELSGEELERFKSFYLSSAKRRQKVEFAAALWKSSMVPAPTPRRSAAKEDESKKTNDTHKADEK
jgi:hypothetical protein